MPLIIDWYILLTSDILIIDHPKIQSAHALYCILGHELTVDPDVTSTLIPNCTRIIAWGMVHNRTLISSMARRLIHNDRVVGSLDNVHYCLSCQLKGDLRLYFVHSCLHFHLCLCWSVIAPLVAMVLITICVKTLELHN